MSEPAVLLVTSAGAPEGSVMPVLAALEAAGLRVRAIDVGRAGARVAGTLDKVVQALAGELAERRLMRELADNPPDVMLAFDPATATALSVVRDEAAHPAPVIAVVTEPEPEQAWAATDADRYLVLDDEAAVDLVEHGVDGERILTIGAVCERAFVDASREDRSALRKQYRIDGQSAVVLVEVAGFGYETSSQIALQLSLVSEASGKLTFLFDAGNDVEAATALRRQVPTLDMRAKLFGKTDDAPRFWRCADVIVARPTHASVARALVLGARMVSLLPQGFEGGSEGSQLSHLAKALEARGLGTTANNTLLLSSALEPLLGQGSRSDDRVGADGAANAADIAWVVGNERRDVIEERRGAARASTRTRVEAATRAAEAAARSSAAAGGLEDLGGDADARIDAEPPDPREVTRLHMEGKQRLEQLGKTVAEARAAAERWEQRRDNARSQGDEVATREAERQCDAERARMHAALAEMAQLQAELERMEKAAQSAPPPRRPAAGSSTSARTTADRSAGRHAGQGSTGTTRSAQSPSVDDLLAQMKRQHTGTGAPRSTATQGSASRTSAAESASERTPERTIDDELAALKRKMSKKKP